MVHDKPFTRPTLGSGCYTLITRNNLPMDVNSPAVKSESALALDTEWDEARIVEALARLQEMHIQVGTVIYTLSLRASCVRAHTDYVATASPRNNPLPRALNAYRALFS